MNFRTTDPPDDDYGARCGHQMLSHCQGSWSSRMKVTGPLDYWKDSKPGHISQFPPILGFSKVGCMSRKPLDYRIYQMLLSYIVLFSSQVPVLSLCESGRVHSVHLLRSCLLNIRLAVAYERGPACYAFINHVLQNLETNTTRKIAQGRALRIA